MKRLAARSAGSASASFSISTGSSTPIFSSGLSASAAQWRVSSSARARSVSNETFISIMRSIASGARPAFSRPSASAGSRVSV